MSEPPLVNFMDAKVGDESYVYVDVDELTEHWCVFQLDFFDDRDRAVTLRRQRWQLLSDEELILPDPITPDEDDVSSSTTPPSPGPPEHEGHTPD